MKQIIANNDLNSEVAVLVDIIKTSLSFLSIQDSSLSAIFQFEAEQWKEVSGQGMVRHQTALSAALHA